VRYRRTCIIFWPFIAIWNLVGLILKMTGRLISSILGLILMIIGGILCFTIIGAIVGIPLAAFGFAMVLRGFF
jgi:uncharacterized membrane protein